jgi:hypothetical protein
MRRKSLFHILLICFCLAVLAIDTQANEGYNCNYVIAVDRSLFWKRLFESLFKKTYNNPRNDYILSTPVNPNTEKLFFSLLQAGAEKKPYFSAQLFYNYHFKNVLWKMEGGRIVPLSIEETDLNRVVRYDVGKSVLLYGIDLAHCQVNGWFSGVDASKRRATVISIVKKAWKDDGASPIVSWHIENPYVPHSFYSKGGDSRACIFDAARSFDMGNGKIFKYPASHSNVPLEIMNNTQYDDGKIIKDDDGHWLPSESSTLCGKGRIEEGDDLVGYESPSDWFDAAIKDLCDLINEFVDEKGVGIPVILRLYHEPETSFAWWGYGVSKKDYVEFYRFTVEKIRESCHNNNILYAYCKDRYWDEKSYGDRYPGDEYVDIVGYDDYTICTSDYSDDAVINRMRVITDFAKQHGKVAALFETGNKTEYGRSHHFLSNNLYNCLMADGVNLGIVQLWSTFTTEGDEKILNDYKRFVRKPNINVLKKKE